MPVPAWRFRAGSHRHYHDAMSSLEFCTDADLGYERNRTAFAPGAGLVLDESYRLAHLPLLRPGHPRAIEQVPGKFYSSGRHPNVYSLVLPIDSQALERSAAFVELTRQLRGAPFASKIAWELLPKRADKLHATICGSLFVGAQPYRLSDPQRAALAGIGQFTIELRGLFSGNVNVGRLYLPVYPQKVGGGNILRRAQSAMNRPLTDMFLVGMWNFVDDLTVHESRALQDMLRAWRGTCVLRARVSQLWMLEASDDLVLDGRIDEVIEL
jgi:hypothetical protein